MTSSKWTPDQYSAITVRDCNLLVSAAAGSGKTAVLVERIITMITDSLNGVDVDKLLVVTFTKAAAAEMRERISAAVIKQLEQHPESSHLNRQLILLNRASITTLHSFCLDVLRQYFYRIDLDPAFRVAEDTEAALLRVEALEDLFEENYAAENNEFLRLVDAYGGDKDDDYLQETVLRLYDFASSNPWPNNWLMSLACNYYCPEGTPLEQLPWGRELMDWLKLELQGCRDKTIKSVQLVNSPDGPSVYHDNLINDLSLLEDLIRAANISWQRVYEEINGAVFSKLKSCKNKDVDEKLKTSVQNNRDSVKRSIKSLKDGYFSRTQEELIADLKLVAPMVESLAKLVVDFGERYRGIKAEKSLVDFSDLEHYCLKILMDDSPSKEKIVPSDVACELREFFAEVFVDEYQDINGVQETILQLISRDEGNKPNRFMVGDVKQSIYGFRLADPKLFLDKYETYPRTHGEKRLGIDLKRNFRSRSDVLDAVNYIFRQIMTGRAGEIEYDHKAELVCGAEFPVETGGIISAIGPVEIHLLDKILDSTDSDESEEIPDTIGLPSEYQDEFPDRLAELDATQREARLVGQRIRKIINGSGENQVTEFHVYDKKAGGYRPVQYRDIVILLRTTKNVANAFMEEFRKLSIPSYAELGTGYFEATEIENMMALLKIIDNPRRDIPLAALLRSPVVGLNAEEMAGIRLRDIKGDYYDAVRKSAELGETPVDLKLRELLKKLEIWRTLARQEPVSELIWRLYNDTEYYSYVGGLQGGAQRQSNLRALQDRARQYESTSFRGLFRFLRFIEKFQESGKDLGTARSLGENENVVRIISIHKSKGLEFPVVIVAGLGKQFNLSDLKRKALLHKQLGIGLPVVDTDTYLTYQTIAQHAIKRRLHLELLAEEMRVLYVALTRAKEKLILVGSVRELDKTANRWCESVSVEERFLPDSVLFQAKSFLDWVCPAVARHPDGLLLRKMGLCDEHSEITTEDVSRWSFATYKAGDILLVDRESVHDQTELFDRVSRFDPVQTTSEHEDLINQRLSWKYPFAKAAGKPSKASVSEIKRRYSQEMLEEQPINLYQNLILKRPGFLSDSTVMSAAERGIAMHLVMQHIRFDGNLTEQGINSQIELMAEKELMTIEQAKTVDISAIYNLIRSSLGCKLIGAQKIKREVPFTMSVPAYKIYHDLDENSEERVLVQGVIDCLIEEDDGYVIIDYKTDMVSGDLGKIVDRYRGQMNLYTEAVEKILHKPVKERYLYLFSIGTEIRCDLFITLIK